MRISETDREKIAKLPVWARDLIKRLEYANEPMVEEVVKSRRELAQLQAKVRSLSDANAALMEILRCAGRGGSDWAKIVVDTLDGYEIYRSLQSDQKGDN